MPLSFKDNIGNIALENTVLGTAALGTIALENIVLGKSLINQPLVQYLLDYLLGRSFNFISQSLVRSFSGEKAIKYYNY